MAVSVSASQLIKPKKSVTSLVLKKSHCYSLRFLRKASTKKYETQKTYRKTKNCLTYQQSIGLCGASCYLCQYSVFPTIGKKVTGKRENLQKNTFQKSSLFAITEQLLSYCRTLVTQFAINENSSRSFDEASAKSSTGI